MTQTFIAGLRCDKLTAPFVINAPMDRPIFETYVEKELAPTLTKGDVVIMDNLPAHKSKAAEKAIKARGAWGLFLPPYSPDLNPIEMAFAKLKTHLRAKALKTIDALWQEIGRICDLFTPLQRRRCPVAGLPSILLPDASFPWLAAIACLFACPFPPLSVCIGASHRTENKMRDDHHLFASKMAGGGPMTLTEKASILFSFPGEPA
jgi:transposase